MKMKLRKPVLFLLLVTVLAPIVLYTDTLGSYFSSPSSSRTEFIEDLSTFTFGGDVRPLNVLPQESSTSLKEPRGDVYSENSGHYLSNTSDTLSSDDARKTRQLTEESMRNQTATGSNNNGVEVAMNGNFISQVTDGLHEPQQTDKNSLKQKNESRAMETSSEKKTSPTDSNHTLVSTSTEIEIRHDQPTVQTSGRVVSGETREKDEERNAQMVLPDARVRQLKDQLIRAKVYLSLSATRNNAHFIRELRLRIKEVQRALGEATKDSDLTRNANEKLKAMEQTLAKGKQIQDDCVTIVKKLRAMLHSAEEQLRVHKKQTLYLTHLTAKTLPKGLHCLPLRLSTEYFKLNSSQQHFPHQENLVDTKLHHYALFSDNILAAAVVINSTVSHAKDPSKHVFHIVTDGLNYAAMRMWFLTNPPQYATVDVQNVEEFTWLNSSYSPVLKQLNSQSMIDYYFRSRADSDPNVKFRNPKYLSIMNHLRFYLPEIFPKLDKVLFLDDDIVVQKDLTGLWSLDLKGKVIGVVETCGESFHRFDRYLNFSNPLISKNFDPRACGWAFGMNIFDLNEWRRQNITEVYHSWQNLNHERQLWKLGTLPPGLITFWKRTYALDRSWHVLGLGYNPNVSQKDIQRAAVIHYNGNLKPWLEISIPKFRNYWSKFIDYDQVFLRECNINKLAGS
ncbi:unnamed protein product [Withania somnifera]